MVEEKWLDEPTTQIKEVREIPKGLSILQQSIIDLNENISLLEKRLEGLLSPSTAVSGESAEPSNPSATYIGSELFNLNQSVNYASSRIGIIRGRLEV